MTTRQRLDLLTRAEPRIFPRAELERLLREQLGDIDALDQEQRRGGIAVRAQAPRWIYHICAGNLAVSAITSLGLGLLLGARNLVKLPGDRDDASTRRDIMRFIAALPAPLKKLVRTSRTTDPALLANAPVVIAFGSDATMATLRAQVPWNHRFIAHGHALSLLFIEKPAALTQEQARACAKDVLTYDQLGCLSPQAIYVPSGTKLEPLATQLADALETEYQQAQLRPHRPIATSARIAEARDLAYAQGLRVWLPPKRHLGWTLILDPAAAFQPSPLHGVIYLRSVTAAALPRALTAVAGRISTIGHAGPISSRWQDAFLSLGASRFCPAGHMQFPPLTWHHEGRPVLADLVTWIDLEGAA